MNNFTGVSIILGVTDEGRSLAETVERIMELCTPGDIEKFVLVKAKNASDESLSAIAVLEREYPDKIYAFEQKSPGVGGAIRDGMAAITSSHTMLLASDNAQDLDCVPIMIESARREPEVICKTSRWLVKNSFHGYGAAKLAANRAAQSFLRTLYHSKLTDFTNPVQIAPTALYRSIDWECTDFSFLPEMVLKPLRLGCEFREIPTACYKRTVGKSKNSFRQTAAYLGIALRARAMKPQSIIKGDAVR